MFKKLICLVVLFSLLGPATSVSADLIGHWPLDGNPNDISANGYDGVAEGGVTYREGVHGPAADFNGSDALINCGDVPVGDTGAISIAFWVKPRNIAQNWAGYVSKWTLDNAQRTFWLGQHSTDGWLRFGFYPGGPTAETSVDSGQVILANEEWTHIVCTHDGNIQRIYADGVEVVASPERNAGIVDRGGNLRFGIVSTANWFNGLIDDVRIYDHALSEAEILGAMTGEPWPYAFGPDPADGVLLEATWATLSWKPGDFAVSHDVYLGDNFEDVNNGTGDTFLGNQSGTSLIVGFPGFAYPDGLVPGTTYYWRIDEVNDADPNSPWKGPVWSFWIQPRTAYNPSPADGAKNVLQDATLNWAAGMGASLHQVYFGDNFDDVNSASGAALQQDATYTPGTLEADKTYYWRVDEFDNTGATHKGTVWSFTTVPNVQITDPNLVGWWTLDEGEGTTAVDWSGHGNHGEIRGNAQWVDGYQRGTVELDGKDDFIDLGNPPNLPSGTSARSVSAWVTTNSLSSGWAVAVGYGSPAASQANGFARNGRLLSGFGYGNDLTVENFWQIGVWYHLCLTYDGTMAKLYADGVQLLSEAKEWNLTPSRARIGRQINDAAEFWNGLVDDVRIYNKVLTAEEIQQLMLGDTKLAGNPVPDRDAIVDISDATLLSWSAGDTAASHDVYFGTDRDAVANATSDSPEFQGNQAGTSLSLAGLVEFAGGDYFWRIDEVEAGGTIHAGTIWKFTVPDYLIVDNFEDYDVGNNEIWWSWKDGLGYAEYDNEPAYAGNETGSAVGDETSPTYMEMSIVHGGGQSMPLSYDNNKQGYAKYSETELTLPASERDWTAEGVSELSLWFRGESDNAAERLYVAVADAAVVYHDDPNAAQLTKWTEWVIPLQSLAGQGITLTNVDRIAIGLGTRGNTTNPGGAGKMYFDEIALYRP